MAEFNSSPNNTNNSVVLERASVIPITKEALLNQYLRDLTTPNIDSKKNYYKGIVTYILGENQTDYRVDDIFLDPIAEQDRSSDSNTTKNDRKILYVHVPFFTTSDKIKTTETSNYDNFNKLKIIYTDNKPVEIGNIVLIEFESKENFLNPRIKDIIKSENSFKPEDSGISILTFDKSEQIPFLDINPPATQDQIQKKEITSPGGGYDVALKEIEKVFQSNFINNFISTLDAKIYENLSKIVIQLDKVTAKEDLLTYTQNLPIQVNYPIILETDSFKKNYLLYVYATVSIEGFNSASISSEFFNYIKLFFSSSFRFTADWVFLGDNMLFSLDINLNQINKTSKTLKNYLDVLSGGFERNYVYQDIPKKTTPAIITNNIV